MPRKPGYRHIDETRAKIQVSQIINRLQTHLNAPEPIMDPSQVNAAKILLGKVLPDLKAVEMGGPNGGAIQYQDVGKITDDELARIATVGGAGTSET